MLSVFCKVAWQLKYVNKIVDVGRHVAWPADRVFVETSSCVAAVLNELNRASYKHSTGATIQILFGTKRETKRKRCQFLQRDASTVCGDVGGRQIATQH